MELSMLQAIKNVVKDKKWILKIFVIALLTFISSVLGNLVFSKTIILSDLTKILFYVISLIITMYTTGYCIKTLNQYLNFDNNEMADLVNSNYFLLGLSYICVCIIYSIIIAIPLFIVCFAMFKLYFLFAIFLSKYFIGNLFLTTWVPAIPFVILLSFVLIYLGLLFNIVFIYFSKDLSFKKAFNIKGIFKVISENHHTCWSLIGKLILFGLSFLAAMLILIFTLIGIILIPMLQVYGNLVLCDLYAQFAKKIDINKYY